MNPISSALLQQKPPSRDDCILLASFNVDGLRARIDGLANWLSRHLPDVVALQEIKCLEEQFPKDAIEKMGYRAVLHGEKGRNGVAILTRINASPPQIRNVGLPSMPNDPQSRYLEVSIPFEKKKLQGLQGLLQPSEHVESEPGDRGDHSERGGSSSLTIICVYMPNGNPVNDDVKFPYKKRFMKEMFDHWHATRLHEGHMIALGDFNVAPTSRDLFEPQSTNEDALSHDDIRTIWRCSTEQLGLVDAWRSCHGLQDHGYTEYSYFGGRIFKNQGFRIDFALLSPSASNHLVACAADFEQRSQPKPSNHLPLLCYLSYPTLPHDA